MLVCTIFCSGGVTNWTARTELNEQVKFVFFNYAPEAKKVALAALKELRKNLTVSGKTVQVYKTFKVQFPSLVENQKETNFNMTAAAAAYQEFRI